MLLQIVELFLIVMRVLSRFRDDVGLSVQMLAGLKGLEAILETILAQDCWRNASDGGLLGRSLGGRIGAAGKGADWSRRRRGGWAGRAGRRWFRCSGLEHVPETVTLQFRHIGGVGGSLLHNSWVIVVNDM